MPSPPPFFPILLQHNAKNSSACAKRTFATCHLPPKKKYVYKFNAISAGGDSCAVLVRWVSRLARGTAWRCDSLPVVIDSWVRFRGRPPATPVLSMKNDSASSLEKFILLFHSDGSSILPPFIHPFPE
ncbi:hypothetical protein CDAR_236461 [Caerostris darwini]|uniref:Uncharacterized protein n=1 Tax=Caerostris darwini TaxID=1538125 RepID=A0AAV4TBY5_9ARAC|nr:hypothetical protein CDAR_236461 [Caerostris darwini]